MPKPHSGYRPHHRTGATGFVGGAFVLEFLRRTEDAVVCLPHDAAGDPAARS
ncbi:SDR family oxidoreductase [Nocardia pseudovaccinii]|uniref:SDR family oxidoreductase n=1 Tax=Nocardia pseudovaccinii TaxID=189540 RepID=UPI003D8BBFFE